MLILSTRRLGFVFSLLCFFYCLNVQSQQNCTHCQWQLEDGECVNPDCPGKKQLFPGDVDACGQKHGLNVPLTTIGGGPGGGSNGIDVMSGVQNLQLEGDTEPVGTADSPSSEPQGACAMSYSSQITTEVILNRIPAYRHTYEQMIKGKNEEEAVIILLDRIIAELAAVGTVKSRQEVLKILLKPDESTDRVRQILTDGQAEYSESLFAGNSVNWMITFIVSMNEYFDGIEKDEPIEGFLGVHGQKLGLVCRVGQLGDTGTTVIQNVENQLYAQQQVVVMFQHAGEPLTISLEPVFMDGLLISVDITHAQLGVWNVAAENILTLLLGFLTMENPADGGDSVRVIALLKDSSLTSLL